MDFRFNPLSLQFLGFINTPTLFGTRAVLNYSLFETNRMELSEVGNLDLELPENLILGKRVEHFFAYYIRHFSLEKILLQGRVISKNRITIGELDFILQNKVSHQIIHVELVFKYYIYDPDIEEGLNRWIGPNRKDTLVKKIEKLKLHQLPLLFREESRQSFEPITCPVEKIQQKICFKANLFVPLNFLNQKLPLINPAAVSGYWIREEEFLEEKFGKKLFYSPKKQFWPIYPEYCCRWYSFSEISKAVYPLLREQKSPLLWMKNQDGTVEQFFLVWW